MYLVDPTVFFRSRILSETPDRSNDSCHFQRPCSMPPTGEMARLQSSDVLRHLGSIRRLCFFPEILPIMSERSYCSRYSLGPFPSPAIDSTTLFISRFRRSYRHPKHEVEDMRPRNPINIRPTFLCSLVLKETYAGFVSK